MRGQQQHDWTYEGYAHVFGDDLGIDGDLMPLSFALQRETRPEVLGPHLFAGLDPGFSTRVRPRDIVVAGRRFAQGNPHIQGLLGIRGLGLGLICESISSGSFRNAVNAGLDFLPACPDVRSHVQSGNRLRVDFETGAVINLDTGWCAVFPPMSPALRAIVELGGWGPHFKARLAARA